MYKKVLLSALQKEIDEVSATGRDYRGVCPVCKGGGSGEKSLWIGYAGTSLYAKCHRATCDVGNVYLTRSLQVIPHETGPARKAPRPYTGETRVLSAWEANMLFVAYGISETQGLVQITTETPHPRLVLSVYNDRGLLVGTVVKRWDAADDWDMPKAVTYRDTVSNDPFMAWYIHEPVGDNDIVLVEDQLSALRLFSSGVNAVALLGTTLDAERLTLLTSKTLGTLWLALDGDMHIKTVSYMKRYGNAYPLKALLIDDDVKDMEQEEYEIFLNKIRRLA